MATDRADHATRHALGRTVRANLPIAELYEDAIRHGEGLVAAEGPLVVRTGKHTGRSPEDKFIVDEPSSRGQDLVGPGQPADLRGALRTAARPPGRLLRGARPVQPGLLHRRGRRRIGARCASTPRPPGPASSPATCSAGRRADQLAGFAPNFTIICVPSFQADPATEGTRTGTAILVHLEPDGDHHRRHRVRRRDQEERLHGHELPDARRGRPADALGRSTSDQDGDAAVFFGLSGTGKTTLSADPLRSLIGDDEHGWGDGITFNFEGGCYAKTIRLSPMYEPDIFQTTRRFGTVLENVDLDPRTRALDLDSERFTENTRGAYPLEFIGNADETGIAGTPRTVVFLTADAFGVLPPISQAHPRAGGLPLHQRLHRQAGRHRGRGQGAEGHLLGLLRGAVHAAPPGRVRARCWSSASSATTSRSGWSTPAGPAARTASGERMNIAHTRSMVRAASTARLDGVPTRTDPNFGVEVPTELPGRARARFLDPRGDVGRPGERLRPRRRAKLAARCSQDELRAPTPTEVEPPTATRCAGPATREPGLRIRLDA